MDCEHKLPFKQLAKLTESWSVSKPIVYTCEQCRRSCELEWSAGLRILSDALPLLLGLIALLVYYTSVTVKTLFQAVPGVVIAIALIYGARYGLIWLYYRLGAFKYSSAEYHNILSKSKK